ncbi:MAG TPA: hypothetical protein VGL86_02630 [Polyangia bacterium]|jgi:hypothetical protein
MSADKPRPELARVVSQSARSAPNLVVLVTWLTAGLLIGHWWLAIAGGCLYLVLVARNSVSPRYWQKLLAADAMRARQLPAETSLIDPTLQLIVRAIAKGYDEIARVMKTTPAPVRAHLAPAFASLDELQVRTAQLVRDADELARYLAIAPRDGAEREIERLREAVTRATEPSVKREYEGALSVREDQKDAVARVALEHERMVAALQFIVGTVEAFPAFIYRMRVLELRAKDDRVQETHEELARMKSELAVSQQLLEGLVDDSIAAAATER